MSAQAATALGGRPAPASEKPPGLSARKAALLLHALPESDRAWLLAQLPQPERESLRALLGELQSLGIPADRALVDEVVASAAGGEVGRPGAGGAAADSQGSAGTDPRLALIARAPADRLAALLRDEPPGLVACVLDLHDWPWRKALLRRLGPEKARRVEALAAATGAGRPGAGTSAKEHLLDALWHGVEREGRLEAAGRGPGSAIARGLWSWATGPLRKVRRP